MKKHIIGISMVLGAIIAGWLLSMRGIAFLRDVLAPADLQFFVTTPTEMFRDAALFSIGVICCTVLIAVAGYYCRYISFPTRMAGVILPMFIGAGFGAVQISRVFREVVASAEMLGISPSIGVNQVPFYAIPLLGLLGGLLGVSVGYLLRKRTGQQIGGVNECSAAAPHS